MSQLDAIPDIACVCPLQIGTAGILLQESLTGQTTLAQLASGHVNPFGDGQGFF
jgi:hypothetical protein